MLDVHIVSLVRETERRSASLKRSIDCGLNAIFFDALNIVDSGLENFSEIFNEKEFYKKYNRLPAPGEVGNTISHLRLYKKLAKDKVREFHIIMEDDFVPKCDHKDILEIIDSTNGNFDIIILGYSKVNAIDEQQINRYSPIMTKCSTDKYKIGVKFNESTCGTVAYIVSKRFVQHMANFNQLPFHLSDDWSFFKKLNFRIFHISPLCFYEDFNSLSSSINENDRKNRDRIRLPKVLRPSWRLLRGNVVYFLMRFGIFSRH